MHAATSAEAGTGQCFPTIMDHWMQEREMRSDVGGTCAMSCSDQTLPTMTDDA